ncbi:MFS transporter [Odoribacter lunatus]|uniref:MFS transporter n=1 Tax=Odoribacter lunatus TaxID=2941335 RepID=UPI002040553D|nr:MFS transporter [Odoribacter lunatus]
MSSIQENKRSPWLWIPSLYLTEGLPYIIVISISIVMYRDMNISNTDIAFYTSLLYLPWVIKPLWSPLVDIFSTKRRWILITQLLMAIGLGGIAFSLPSTHFFLYSLLFFWLLAFCSATHDIAADGFYMLGLSSNQQAYFVGIRTTFYRLATIVGIGSIFMVSDSLQQHLSPSQSWLFINSGLGIFFLLLGLYHYYILPQPISDYPHGKNKEIFKEFISTFISFFHKKHIGTALAFMLLFRLSESQLLKLVYPFLLDSKENGGLALNTANVGFIYGSLGMIALTIGGIIGGILIARHGLKHWIGWMTLAINLPNFIYIYLALFQPENLILITTLLTIEQFGYGFGFSAYTFYLILFSAGEHKTAHYALCTGFMALGMMLPGMISGWISDTFGYPSFFMWVMLCTIPSFIVTRYLKIPESHTSSVSQK